MARLSDLLANLGGVTVVDGSPAVDIREVRDDSRLVGPGDLFVAVPGTKADGTAFVDAAIDKGAVAVLTQSPTTAQRLKDRVVVVQTDSARQALGVIAANHYGAAPRLTLTAVTGTNGKTTTTYLVEAILLAAGRKPGVIGTVGYRFGSRHKDAALTTPGALELHANLAEMLSAGATDVVMEASSIALEQGRLAGCRFKVAALTNVTQDHLDYHGTMDRYVDAKAILFRERMVDDGTGVFFVDDDSGTSMRARARCKTLTLTRQGNGADVCILERRLGARGIFLRLGTPLGSLEIESQLVGDFNVANILTAVGIAVAHGVPAAAITHGIAQVRGVPGRLEPVANEAGVLCVVDYAHTPDALERALDVLRPLTQGRLICVFGCGGDRDRTKRPLMGRAAVERADISIVTSDNPRTESPESIIDMILEGAARSGKARRSVEELAGGGVGYAVEADRWTAISRAIALARMGDVVLLAGKGHEDYQIIGTQKHHFDDREIAAAAFAARRGA